MKKIVLILISTFVLWGSDCGVRKFSINVGFNGNEDTSIKEILSYLSSECKFSIVVQDASAHNQISQNIGFINIMNAQLKEVLDLVLTDNDISYSFDGRKLKLSKYMTKTFKLDYLNFTKRSTTTTNNVQTGSSTESGEDSTSINYSSEFNFWDEILEKINFILDSTKSETSSFGNTKTQAQVPSGSTMMPPPNAIGAKSAPVAPKSQDGSKIAMISKEAGLITVKGTRKQILAIGQYIKDLADRMHKQVLIEANIIEVTYNNTQETGIDWSKFELSLGNNINGTKQRDDGSTSFNSLLKSNYLVNYNFDINGLIKFLKTYGDVSLVSSPKVLTLNNQAAIVNVGEEVNFRYQKSVSADGNNTTVDYTYDSRFIGVTLDITPQISDSGDIILKINPVISEISDYNDKTMAPDIKVKRLASIVRVADGNKIVIGGLIEKRTTTEDTNVPMLNKIPLIGRLFKYKKNEVVKSEIIIVITPHLVNFERPRQNRRHNNPRQYSQQPRAMDNNRVNKPSVNNNKNNFLDKYRIYLNEK